MHLNQLYGYFGRSLDLIDTINVHISDLRDYMFTKVIDSFIKVNEDIYVLLIKGNLSTEIIKELNASITTKNFNFSSSKSIVKSNVAIASAVTAYARICMLPYKLLSGTIYTDTDSIFTTVKLDDMLVGKELGMMKDELDGLVIEEGYFLGIKQYGYWFYDSEGYKIEKSVFAGVQRDSLTFPEIKSLYEGKEITKEIETRFYKNLDNLSINIKPSKITIKFKTDKELIDNEYQPIKVNLIKSQGVILLEKVYNVLSKIVY
jgi:hypothetical protein